MEGVFRWYTSYNTHTHDLKYIYIYLYPLFVKGVDQIINWGFDGRIYLDNEKLKT